MATRDTPAEAPPLDPSIAPSVADTASRLNGRVSITVTLATAIGLLVLISVGGVLGLGIWIAKENTFSLLSRSAHQGITANVAQVEQHLAPAAAQARFVGERVARGEIDPADQDRLALLLTGALAAAPQIAAVLFIDPQLQALTVGRNPENDRVGIEVVDYAADPVIREAMSRPEPAPSWGPPVWRDRYGMTFLNYLYPVVRDGTFLGVVISVISVEQLSSFVAARERETAGTGFILYGNDLVLAHGRLVDGYAEGSNEHPLPALSGFADSVLAAIWQAEGHYDLDLDLPGGTEGHVMQLGGEEYVFLYQRVGGFGPLPLTVGAYFEAADVSAEVRRMMMALIVGVAALLVSLLAAVMVGKRIAKPIVRFSGAAAQIRDLEISKVRPLAGSVFRELNDQSIAFNSMLRALRWFELYVPRSIVERLVRRGSLSGSISDAREITVMFTDIAGFSAVSEGMTAPEVATFVNHHFSLLAACVEAEDGTVDKFIGDSVMAFWGAPEHQPDAAARACRAALAIRDAIREDNLRRVAAGEPAVHVRIGIHTGTATVGNIGAPGRLNYTIIGDTVNVGQRLEQLGKEVGTAADEVTILVSGDTARQLGSAFKPVAAGSYRLKGRAGEIDVFRL
ncbi:MAG: adenylate/guanylate cyclase domain-containing protein [Alphaproteobacteria bacterium]